MILKPTTIYVSLNGDVLEESRTTIYRYSDINEIRLVSPLAVEGGMRVNFLLGNGVTIEQKVMTALTEKETVGDEEWNVWSYRPTNVITSSLSAQSVTTLKLSFTQITLVDNKEFGNTFGTTTLSVSPTIQGPEPTLEDANALTLLQSNLSTLTLNKIDRDLDYSLLTVYEEEETFLYVYYNGGSYKFPLSNITSETGGETGGANVFFFNTLILPTNNWQIESGAYVLTKTGGDLTGLIATDRPIIDIDLSDNDIAKIPSIQEAWGKVYRAEIIEDTIKFYATENPQFTENTKVILQVVR